MLDQLDDHQAEAVHSLLVLVLHLHSQQVVGQDIRPEAVQDSHQVAEGNLFVHLPWEAAVGSQAEEHILLAAVVDSQAVEHIHQPQAVERIHQVAVDSQAVEHIHLAVVDSQATDNIKQQNY